MNLQIIIIIISLMGLYVAYRIGLEKKKGEKMVCPINGDCKSVLFSKYAKTFGVPLEIAGFIYYLLIAVAYFLIATNPMLQIDFLSVKIFKTILILITFAGFLFSAYLTILQWKIIKAWCSWCLASAIVSTIIFLVAFHNYFAVELTYTQEIFAFFN